MKYFKTLHLVFVPLFFLTQCPVHSNFYPDPDDPGLSRFTSRGYNVSTSYINGMAYQNQGGYYPLLYKDSSGNNVDTLKFSWALWRSDSQYTYRRPAFDTISFFLPVPRSFNKMNLLAFNGQRFLNSVPFTLMDSASKVSSGIATLYFVSVKEDLSYPPQKYITLSGLFDGNIGDSVIIKKGRFDFQIIETLLNF